MWRDARENVVIDSSIQGLFTTHEPLHTISIKDSFAEFGARYNAVTKYCRARTNHEAKETGDQNTAGSVMIKVRNIRLVRLLAGRNLSSRMQCSY